MNRWRKLFAVAGLVTALSGAALLATEGVAFAHHAILSGTVSCPGPDHVIDWSITNSQKKETMSVTSAVATLNGVDYSVDGYVNPIPDSGSTSATTTIPGDLTGTVTLSIKSSWSDGHKRPGSTTVNLTDPCPTTPTTTSSTTTAPPTTTKGSTPPPSDSTTVTTYVGTTSPCVSTAVTPCTLAFTDGSTVPVGQATGAGLLLVVLGALGIGSGGIAEARRRLIKRS